MSRFAFREIYEHCVSTNRLLRGYVLDYVGNGCGFLVAFSSQPRPDELLDVPSVVWVAPRGLQGGTFLGCPDEPKINQQLLMELVDVRRAQLDLQIRKDFGQYGFTHANPLVYVKSSASLCTRIVVKVHFILS